MSLIARLTEKPWQNPGIRTPLPDEKPRPSAVAVGLVVFLFVVVALFSLIASAYLMRMGWHSSLGHGAGDWRALSEPPLLWFNTAALALGSIAWELARMAARRGRMRDVKLGVAAAGLLTLVFVTGQAMVWWQFQTDGYLLSTSFAVCTPIENPLARPTLAHFMSGNPALAFFYLITGLHALHMLGGLVAWGRTELKLARGDASATRALTFCAIYWHVLLLVWVAMFALMLSS